MFHKGAEIIAFYFGIEPRLFQLFLYNQCCIVHFFIIRSRYENDLLIIISGFSQKFFCFFYIILIVVFFTGIGSPLLVIWVTPSCIDFIQTRISVSCQKNIITVQSCKCCLSYFFICHNTFCCIQEQVQCTAALDDQLQS